MCNCPYDIGDKVKKDGLCGEVIDKRPLGKCWVLTVKLDTGGGIVSWVCSEVTGC